MSPSEQANAILEELDFRAHEFFVGGSGPMALRDMRPLGDLDIGVTTGYWFELWSNSDWDIYTPPKHSVYERCDPPYLHKPIQGIQVNVFFAWRLREHQPAIDSDYNEIFRKHVEQFYRPGFTRSWPCMRLELLLKLKAQEQRGKDFADIAQIAEHIGSGLR